MTYNDRDLKHAFTSLGIREAAEAPTFDQLASRAALNVARSRQRRRRVVLAAATITLPAVFILRARGDDPLDYERFTALTGIDLNEVTWEAPSDFLLDIPGRDILHDMPRMPVDTPADALDSVQPVTSNKNKGRSSS
jgi:hypothetical protein